MKAVYYSSIAPIKRVLGRYSYVDTLNLMIVFKFAYRLWVNVSSRNCRNNEQDELYSEIALVDKFSQESVSISEKNSGLLSTTNFSL